MLFWLTVSAILSGFLVEGHFFIRDTVTVIYEKDSSESYEVILILKNDDSVLVLKVKKLETKSSVQGDFSSPAPPNQEISTSETGEEYILKLAADENMNPYIKNEFKAYVKLGATNDEETRPKYLPRVFVMGTTIVRTNNTSFTANVFKMEVVDMNLANHYEENMRRKDPNHHLTLLSTMWTILVEIHKQGVMHRDVKCQNFMLRKGVVVIIDFELALYAGSPFYESEMFCGGTPMILPLVRSYDLNNHSSKLYDFEMMDYDIYLTVTGSLPWKGMDSHYIRFCKRNFTTYLQGDPKKHFGLSSSICNILIAILDLTWGDCKNLATKYMAITELISNEWKTLNIPELAIKDMNNILDEVDKISVQEVITAVAAKGSIRSPTSTASAPKERSSCFPLFYRKLKKFLTPESKRLYKDSNGVKPTKKQATNIIDS